MTYYRYEVIRWTNTRISLACQEFKVLKETTCGVWLEVLPGEKPRFVMNSARKRFACPTKEEALDSFKARKRRQVQILRARLSEAERALLLTPEDPENFAPLDLSA